MRKKFKWTKELCVKNAAKYDTNSQWQKENGGCYNAALRNSWLKDCQKHFKNQKKITKTDCLIDALKYETRTAWQKKSNKLYMYAWSKGWLKSCTKHMTPKSKLIAKKALYWTKEKCIKDAQNYNGRNEWLQKSSGAYNSAWKNNWLDDCCHHMKTTKQLRFDLRKWTVPKLTTLSKKYASIKEWNEKDPASYAAAGRLKCIHQCTSHMKSRKEVILETVKWNEQKCFKIAQKYSTKNSFNMAQPGAYAAIIRNKWQSTCFSHMPEFSNQIRRESKFQKNVIRDIKKKFKDLEIIIEYTIPKKYGINGRVDLLIKNKKTEKFILLELKHDKSQWSRNHIKNQIQKYEIALSKAKGYSGVFVISNNGKYGHHIHNLSNIISKTIL